MGVRRILMRCRRVLLDEIAHVIASANVFLLEIMWRVKPSVKCAALWIKFYLTEVWQTGSCLLSKAKNIVVIFLLLSLLNEATNSVIQGLGWNWPDEVKGLFIGLALAQILDLKQD